MYECSVAAAATRPSGLFKCVLWNVGACIEIGRERERENGITNSTLSGNRVLYKRLSTPPALVPAPSP